MVPADRGPAVSGAHDTYDSARAGRDLVSALRSGLLAIGPIWSCSGCVARMFAEVESTDVKPNEFVDNRKRSNKLIMGIGHRIGSLENPDQRVVIIKEYAKANFSSTAILDFESDVGEFAYGHVDGCIGVCFIDMLKSCGAFPHYEVQDFMDFGSLNGLFVLGRSLFGPAASEATSLEGPVG